MNTGLAMVIMRSSFSYTARRAFGTPKMPFWHTPS